MRFLRHRKGNGKVDETSEICPLSTLDQSSQLTEKTSVWSSHLTDTIVKNSTITGAIISRAAIANSIITGGKISDSLIMCELVADFALIEKDSGVFGKSRVAHTAHVENTCFENLTVYGDAHLLNWSDEHTVFDGKEGYISRGIWTRPPRILQLDGLTITEGVPGFAFCGCREYEIKHWLKIGSRYGKTLGLNPCDVQQIREFLLSLQ